MKPARVLMADPPWQFADKLPGNGRGASKHYPCMGVTALCAFRLPKLAPDCLLLLWRVAAMQREALQVVTAWGFTVKSEIVWCKLSKTGKRHMGMGRYVMLTEYDRPVIPAAPAGWALLWVGREINSAGEKGICEECSFSESLRYLVHGGTLPKHKTPGT